MKKPVLLTPGPTPIPPEVAQKAALPILHHRTAEFGRIFTEALSGLQEVFLTQHPVYLFTCSGTGGMEAAAVNVLSPGDEAIVCETGAFGERWTKILQAYGLQPHVVKSEWGDPLDLGLVERALRDHPRTCAVFATLTDTSTTVVNDIRGLGRLVRKTEAVLVVDAVSGLAAQEFRTDEWGVDVAVSASQKGLMNAPGLAFLSVSPRAWARVETARLPRFYWDLRAVKSSAAQKETPFTPAVTLVVALHEALRLIRQEGLPAIWERHARLARATRAWLTALGLKLFSSSPSNVLTAAWLPEGITGEELIGGIRNEWGISLAGGQAKLKGRIVRFAHLGYMDQFDLVVGMSALGMALAKRGHRAPVAAGVTAVLDSLMAPVGDPPPGSGGQVLQVAPTRSG